MTRHSLEVKIFVVEKETLTIHPARVPRDEWEGASPLVHAVDGSGPLEVCRGGFTKRVYSAGFATEAEAQRFLERARHGPPTLAGEEE